jgi:hypothetical protein
MPDENTFYHCREHILHKRTHSTQGMCVPVYVPMGSLLHIENTFYIREHIPHKASEALTCGRVLMVRVKERKLRVLSDSRSCCRTGLM